MERGPSQKLAVKRAGQAVPAKKKKVQSFILEAAQTTKNRNCPGHYA